MITAYGVFVAQVQLLAVISNLFSKKYNKLEIV